MRFDARVSQAIITGKEPNIALAAATQFEAWPTGSDTLCSGGFNPANANFPTDGAATSATGTAPVFTSASYTFVSPGDVGAWVFIKSGTNWTPGWYIISSVSGGSATLNAAIGAAVAYPGAFLTTNGALMVPNTVAGCATTASPTSATWGLDYSQQAAAKIAFTDMIIDATTNTRFTSVANPVGKNMVGNLIKVTSGTGFTVQTVEVVSTATITATCDKSLGTLGSTLGNGYLGGAFAGPQLAAALEVAGNVIWLKSGAYTMSSVTSNGALGKVTLVTNTLLNGYGSVRGDGGTAPVMTASGISGISMITGTAGGNRVVNITVDGATLGTMTGFTTALTESCKAQNCVTGFLGDAYKSTADTCTTGFSGTTSQRSFCVAKSCTTGFTQGFLQWCLSTGCTTGFSFAANGTALHCLAYNSTNGFVASGGSNSTATLLLRCLAHTSSSRGFDMNTGAARLIDCAEYLSTSALRYNSSGVASSSVTNQIACSVDPCTNVSGGDFSLNNTASGGALLRGLSYTWPTAISTTSYADVGPIQSAAPAATGGGAYMLQL